MRHVAYLLLEMKNHVTDADEPEMVSEKHSK